MEESIINIKSVPIIWTTCSKFKDRHSSMELMLSSLEVKGEMVCGPITNPYTVGVAQGYIEALKKYPAPFLILEDDSTLVSEFNGFLPVPKDADALYIGTSNYGRLQKSTIAGGVIAGKVSETLARVFNMLSFHAVLYTNQEYVNRVINLLENFIINPVGGADDCIAEDMWKHKVYALRIPMFYQKDGRSEVATKTPITCIL